MLAKVAFLGISAYFPMLAKSSSDSQTLFCRSELCSRKSLSVGAGVLLGVFLLGVFDRGICLGISAYFPIGVNLRSSFLVGWVERIGPGDPPFKNNTSLAQVPTLLKIESETQRSLLTLANILAYKVGFRSIFEVLCRCIVLRCAWVCVLPLLIRSTQPTGLHTKLTLMGISADFPCSRNPPSMPRIR